MLSRMRAAVLLLPVACLTSCVPGTSITSGTTTPAAGLDGYWQLQNPQSIPAGAIVYQGALQSQGTQVTGIFSSPMGCSPPVVDLTGTLSSSGNLTLAGLSASAQLQVASSDTSATGTAGGGGYLCLAVWAGPVTATRIATAPSASLTGTFTGSVVPADAVSPISSVSVALTESTTPTSTGQISLTGTLTFTGAGCTSAIPVNGTLSGVQVTLASTPNPVTGLSAVTVTAAANPAASQILAGTILFTPSPCSTISTSSSTYTSVLTRQ